MTDKELCLCLKEGRRSALNEAIARYTPYVGAVALEKEAKIDEE